jgi:c-di-GMP-binding flagellar brake protein YcgR
MTQTISERRFPRFDVQVPVRHASAATPQAPSRVGWIRNLSQGGACIEMEERLPAPSPLQIRLQTDQGSVDVEAQVVWEAERAPEKPEDGGGVLCGVAFTYLAPEQMQAIQTLLPAEGAMRRSEVRVPLDLPVTCQARGSEGRPLEGKTGNISRGGLLLRLSQELPTGTLVDLTLHGTEGPIHGEGEVVWMDPAEQRTPGAPIKHGVRFTAMGWSRARTLALLLTGSQQPAAPSPSA